MAREYSKCHLPCKGQHKSLQTPSVSPQGMYTASCFPYAIKPVIKHRPHHRKWKKKVMRAFLINIYIYIYMLSKMYGECLIFFQEAILYSARKKKSSPIHLKDRNTVFPR